MKIRLNQEKKWQQVNAGEIYGNIKDIFGCDLESNLGKIRISEVLGNAVINSVTNTQFIGYPAAMVYTNAGTAAGTTYANWILSNNSSMWFDTSGGFSFVKDRLSLTPSNPLYDMTVFTQTSGSDNLIVPHSTGLSLLNQGSWTSSWWVAGLGMTALSSANPHPVESFLSQYGSFAFVADGRNVHTIDTSLIGAGVRYNRVQLDIEQQIIWIRATDRYVFFGTRNINAGRGKIFQYDLVNEAILGYEIGGNISLAACVKNNIVYSVDDLGVAYKFNGDGFAEIGRLPIYYLQREVPAARWNDGNTPLHMVHHRGMDVIDGKLHILLNAGGSNGSYVFEQFPSGVWVLNEETGNFYCKYRLNKSLTGAFGESNIQNSGFMFPRNQNSFFAGWASFLTSNMRVASPNLTSAGVGRFITPKIYSPDIQSKWAALWALFKKFENATDKMIVKYRIQERFKTFFSASTSIPILTGTCLWTNGTTFTSNNDLSLAQAGDEVEITYGDAAGLTAHISTISEAGGTYTVTLDETFTVTGGNTSGFSVMNWTKIESFSSTNPPQYHEFHMDIPASEWIQFKVELRGTPYSPEIDDLILEFSTNLGIK